MTVEEAFITSARVMQYGHEIVRIVRSSRDDWFYEGMPEDSRWHGQPAYRITRADGASFLVAGNDEVEPLEEARDA